MLVDRYIPVTKGCPGSLEICSIQLLPPPVTYYYQLILFSENNYGF